MTAKLFYSLSSSDVPDLDGLVIAAAEEVVPVHSQAVDPALVTLEVVALARLQVEGPDHGVAAGHEDGVFVDDHDFDGLLRCQE